MVRSFFPILIVLFILLSISAAAVQEDCLYYFYSEDCPTCTQTTELLKGLEEKYPSLNVNYYDVYYDLKQAKVLDDFFTKFQVKEKNQKIPALFIGESYLIGNSSILQFTSGRIIENSNEECPSLESTGVLGVSGKGMNSPNVFDTFTFWSISGQAISSILTINIFALLIIMLWLLAQIKKRDDIVMRGLLFSFGVFIVYLFHASSILSGLAGSNLVLIIIRIIGLWAVLLGLVKVHLFMNPKTTFLSDEREKMRQYWARVQPKLLSNLGILLVSIILSLLTLQKPSQLFVKFTNLAALGLAATIVPIMIYYVLVICSVFIILTIVFYSLNKKSHIHAEKKGNKDESKIQVWRDHHHNVLQFFTGAVMIILGLIVFFG